MISSEYTRRLFVADSDVKIVLVTVDVVCLGRAVHLIDDLATRLA